MLKRMMMATRLIGLTSLLTVAAIPVHAQKDPAGDDGVVQKLAHGEINWSAKTVTATGSGAANLKDGSVAKARLMPDGQGKMGVSLRDAGGEALAVSQFTLLADFTKGNRPSFNGAARPELARPLFDLFVTELSAHLGRPVPTGVFGADMRVELVNDGPVTVVLE